MRDRLRAFALATMPFFVVGCSAAILGCSSPEALGGPGAPCALATDCQEGLVCISLMNQPRQCSNDTAAIQFLEDAGPAAGADAGAPAAPSDAAASDARSMGSDDDGSPAGSDSGATSPDATTDAGEPQEAASSDDGGAGGTDAAPPVEAGPADAAEPLDASGD